MGFDINITKKAALLFDKALGVGMQDFSRLVHICHYALECQNLEGDIVEFGCYKGDTSKLLSYITNKKIFVYDSFEGLPPSSENLPGEMKIGMDALFENFNQDTLPYPNVFKGWFSDVGSEDLPDKICFAHLDGDLYISTIQPLKLIYDRMVKDSIILIDDYNDQRYWPGVKKAVDEFFIDKPEMVQELKGMNGNLSYKAMIRKL